MSADRPRELRAPCPGQPGGVGNSRLAPAERSMILVDAETGEEVEPAVVDRATGRPLDTEQFRLRCGPGSQPRHAGPVRPFSHLPGCGGLKHLPNDDCQPDNPSRTLRCHRAWHLAPAARTGSPEPDAVRGHSDVIRHRLSGQCDLLSQFLPG